MKMTIRPPFHTRKKPPSAAMGLRGQAGVSLIEMIFAASLSLIAVYAISNVYNKYLLQTRLQMVQDNVREQTAALMNRIKKEDLVAGRQSATNKAVWLTAPHVAQDGTQCPNAVTGITEPCNGLLFQGTYGLRAVISTACTGDTGEWPQVDFTDFKTSRCLSATRCPSGYPKVFFSRWAAPPPYATFPSRPGLDGALAMKLCGTVSADTFSYDLTIDAAYYNPLLKKLNVYTRSFSISRTTEITSVHEFYK